MEQSLECPSAGYKRPAPGQRPELMTTCRVAALFVRSIDLIEMKDWQNPSGDHGDDAQLCCASPIGSLVADASVHEPAQQSLMGCEVYTMS